MTIALIIIKNHDKNNDSKITAILAIMTTIKVLTMIIVIAIMVEIMFYLCSTPFDHMKLPLKHNNFSTLAAGNF